MPDFTPFERKKMKGFIHILEIIIVALSVFIAVSLFANIPRIESDWIRTKLVLYGNDLFFALDSKNINWLDKGQVNDSISGLLLRNLGFDLIIRNAIKPTISIGCVCSQDDADLFQEFLNDFEFNGANTSFRVEWINASELSFPVTLDLMLFLDRSIPDNKRGQLERYLVYDKGVLEISTLTTGIVSYPIYQDIFNLEWIDESLGLGPYDAEFQETGPGKRNYNIRKYFYHVPFRTEVEEDLATPLGVTSCTGAYNSGQFSFRGNNYKVWVIDNTTTIPGSCDLALYIDINNNNDLDEPGEGPFSKGDSLELDTHNFLVKEIEWNYTGIVFQEPPEYSFRFSGLKETIHPRDNASEKLVLIRENEIYPDGRSIPVSTINYNMVSGKGRAVWLSNSSVSVSALKSDEKQLINNLIIWAAGEEYWLIKGPERKNPVTLYFYKALDQDMFQPIEIALTLGYRQ